ncbi:hypothetical protein [Kordia sp.]|uniref:hypothetical protein n=1 Tax=Kordia sp. TaxID=1965332 RepID=UPI003D6BF2C9
MRNLTVILLALLCVSCFLITDWNIELWEQKIENSNYSICKFDAWGGRDSHVSGMKLINSAEGFKQSDVMSGHQISYLTSIPSKHKIDGVFRNRIGAREKPFPKIKNAKINIKSYEDFNTVNTKCLYKGYQFKSFKENRNSIIFYSNESVFVDGKDYDEISIPKGNIYIMTDKTNAIVKRITCEEVKFVKDSVTGEVRVCIDTKYFDPINEIKLSEFTDYGIYKPVK